MKEARGIAAPSLIREFRRSNTGPGYRWAVGNALEVVADDAVRRDMIELARDRSFGRDRQMIVLGLSRMRDSEVADVLLELLTDDGVAGHAVKALGRLKVPRARPAIERLVDHATPWVRAEARKALAKLSA